VSVSEVPKRKVRRSGQADLIVRENTHEPLIDRETFQKAQEAIARNRKMTCPKKRTEGRYLLTRLLVCGHCGAYMTGRGDGGKRVYYCGTSLRLGTEVCGHKRVYESLILDQLTRVLQNEFLSPGNLTRLREELTRQAEAQRLAGLDSRLAARIAELARNISHGEENLALLPADRLPGVIAKLRQWERERDQLQ